MARRISLQDWNLGQIFVSGLNCKTLQFDMDNFNLARDASISRCD